MIVSFLYRDNPYNKALEERFGEKLAVCRTKEEALIALPGADIVFLVGGGGLQLDEDMLAVSPNLKLVLSLSAGLEKMPLQLLHDRNIAVCNTKGTHAVTMAEFILGGMLAFAHHFPTFMKNQSAAHWQSFFSGEDLDGQTLLVIGAGAIGSEIAKKAKAFDMKVMGLKRHPAPADYFDEVWGIDRLPEALGLADYVVLVTPLTKETYHLMGAEEFKRMKSTAVFLNVSRGDTVDEAALIEALRQKEIAGAFLDVFHTEPLPKESPLWAMDNVLVTPHNAGPSNNSERRIIKLLGDIIERFRGGQPLINQVKRGEMY